MKIGGVQKLSLVDYPGRTCVAIFTIGCNMRCSFCHNPELVLPERYVDAIPTSEVLDFLKTRVGKIEGVTISGGEPTLQPDLPEFIAQVKKLGFLVKLDSNGTDIAMLKRLFEDKLLDYVAMDIKTVPEKYQIVTNMPVDSQMIRDSIKLIQRSGVDHEFRTTIVKSLISPEDIDAIGQIVKGSSRYALQKFRPGRTLNPQFHSETTYSDKEFEKMRVNMEKYVKVCVVH